MLLLEAVNVKKYYGDRLVIGFDELKVYSGDRIGVTGLNGSGKTTLLDMLYGSLEPDEGYVRRYCEVGYIRQFGMDGKSDIRQLRTEAAGAAMKLLSEFEVGGKLDRPALSGGEQTRLKIAGAFSRETVLMFADEPTSNLDYKGIELFRQKLGKVESFIMVSHDRSLLDALCNRIIEVKDGGIRIFNGNYSFYREQCEAERQRAAAEYEKYIAEKTALEQAISDRMRRAGKVRKAPSRMGNSEARLHKRHAAESQEKLHSAASSLITRLEKLEVKERPKEQPVIRLDLSLTEPPENKIIISADRLSFSYGNVPVFKNAGFRITNGMKTALWGENGTGKTTLLNLVYTAYLARSGSYGTGVPVPDQGHPDTAGRRTGIMPEEFAGTAGQVMSMHTGAGTSTGADAGTGFDPYMWLADRAAAGAARCINIVPRARLAYFRQTFENLDPDKTVLENVMKDSVQNETVARTILARLLLPGANVFKKVGILSGGEKIKVSFAKLLVSRANVLLLDEPTNYLDIQSIEALENVLKDYEGTVLFVSHDRAFVRAVADRLLVTGGLDVRSFEGGLDEYEESIKTADGAKNMELEKTMLRMRITEVVTKLSLQPADREALEEEFRRLTKQLRDLESTN
ncbi:MAG TPA: ABC-F family ATP-binding cassette domain-containing protein [Clostridiales bacterium]|nr:ABC-F family ATP-binding cassette domain-containing protein [Clostridiales bacterium]